MFTFIHNTIPCSRAVRYYQSLIFDIFLDTSDWYMTEITLVYQMEWYVDIFVHQYFDKLIFSFIYTVCFALAMETKRTPLLYTILLDFEFFNYNDCTRTIYNYNDSVRNDSE